MFQINTNYGKKKKEDIHQELRPIALASQKSAATARNPAEYAGHGNQYICTKQ